MTDAEGPLAVPRLRAVRPERAEQDGEPGLALIDPLGIALPIFVPIDLLAVLRHFDGGTTAADIAAAAQAELGRAVAEDLVRQLARDLDQRLMLHGPRFDAALERAAAEWLAGGVRPSSHGDSAGYPAAPARLRAALAKMVTAAPVGSAPPLRGLIAPHIDLRRGHAGYGAAYGRLLTGGPAELYVVFGTGHQGPEAPLTGLGLDWQTPLGTAATDRAFLDRVHAAIGPPRPADLLLHREEHSLEFQVLLLQHLHERLGAPPPRVAGFLCGALPSASGDPTQEDYLRRIVAAFRAAEHAHGGRVCYVAGADLAHLGPFFGDPSPVDQALLHRLERDERLRLQALEQAAPGAFHRAVEGCGNPDRVCSAPAITLTALLAGGPGELLHYGQARADDGSQVVSFCAMGFATS